MGPNGNEETPNGNGALADCCIRTMQQSTAPNEMSILAGFDGRFGAGSLLCRRIYNGFFGSALTFAAKSMHHTANQLQQWAREPDFRITLLSTLLPPSALSYLKSLASLPTTWCFPHDLPS